MFETVAPEMLVRRSRRVLYVTLPISIALHAIAAASIVLVGTWNVAFPTQSPRMYASYQLIATPPPPPPPPPAVQRPITPQVKAVPVKMPFVAPTIIPDLIPEVTSEAYTDVPELPLAEAAGEAGGVEGGIEGGELGGEVGGAQGGLPTAPAPEVIEVERDAPLPVGAISQEYPGYPDFALKRNWEDVLVVRYTIGKDGRVREVIILQPPEREEFARETIGKIRHWRFHPYRDERGEAKEVVHELTVEFKIYRRGKT